MPHTSHWQPGPPAGCAHTGRPGGVAGGMWVHGPLLLFKFTVQVHGMLLPRLATERCHWRQGVAGSGATSSQFLILKDGARASSDSESHSKAASAPQVPVRPRRRDHRNLRLWGQLEEPLTTGERRLARTAARPALSLRHGRPIGRFNLDPLQVCTSATPPPVLKVSSFL